MSTTGTPSAAVNFAQGANSAHAYIDGHALALRSRRERIAHSVLTVVVCSSYVEIQHFIDVGYVLGGVEFP